MAGQERVILRAGSLEVTVLPALGGSIAAFDWLGPAGRVPVLRGAAGACDILDAASFPLVPYVNRIRDGTFRFGGRIIVQKPNMAGDPSPLHGQGWLAAWELTRRNEGTAELRFLHEPGEWPWRYEARQQFTLDPDGLDLALSCTNRSDGPMPCGLGQHPYFPCSAETRLDTEVRWAWTVDEQLLPVERVPAEGRYDLRDRLICGQGLDNGFAGWGGRARLSTPGAPFTVEIASADARFFQVYSPGDGGLVVAEPVSHANAALNAPEENWPELGLRVLGPGETMTLPVRFSVGVEPA